MSSSSGCFSSRGPRKEHEALHRVFGIFVIEKIRDYFLVWGNRWANVNKETKGQKLRSDYNS